MNVGNEVSHRMMTHHNSGKSKLLKTGHKSTYY